MKRIINWFALTASITTFVLLILSAYIPWWKLTVGTDFLTIYASPIVTNFGLYGSQFNIPLIWAWNLANILLFTAGGIVMLAYSFFPTKPWSVDLIGFAWRKPIWAFASFTIGLVVLVFVAGFFDINFPLMGSQYVTFAFPDFIPISASISSQVEATFMLPFWFAIVTVVMCAAARIQHERIEKRVKKLAENASVSAAPTASSEVPPATSDGPPTTPSETPAASDTSTPLPAATSTSTSAP